MALGLAITLIFGASALNALSTNAIFNILFFLMLVIFAASFFGAFEIRLPSKWGNAVDSKAESTTGLLSIFLMAFTLSLVSFSCTGPIIGLPACTGIYNRKRSCSGNRYVRICHRFGIAVYTLRPVPVLAEIDAKVRRMDECYQGYAGFPRISICT